VGRVRTDPAYSWIFEKEYAPSARKQDATTTSTERFVTVL
jgi:hypothetical protein